MVHGWVTSRTAAAMADLPKTTRPLSEQCCPKGRGQHRLSDYFGTCRARMDAAGQIKVYHDVLDIQLLAAAAPPPTDDAARAWFIIKQNRKGVN